MSLVSNVRESHGGDGGSLCRYMNPVSSLGNYPPVKTGLRFGGRLWIWAADGTCASLSPQYVSQAEASALQQQQYYQWYQQYNYAYPYSYYYPMVSAQPAGRGGAESAGMGPGGGWTGDSGDDCSETLYLPMRCIPGSPP